jgi:hypothetical protein
MDAIQWEVGTGRVRMESGSGEAVVVYMMGSTGLVSPP